jgi:hypothetical protein
VRLKKIEEDYPGMELMSLSPPLTTPKALMLEQFQIVAEEVMPHFRSRPAVRDAAQ